MHLLRLSDSGDISRKEYYGDELPPYAILSHTWGADADELTFDDIESGRGKDKAGYAKILFCGRRAMKDGIKHFWVDSCCINKTSSAELSEAINSMFRWYEGAARCYVFLQDVSAPKPDKNGLIASTWVPAFRNSRWFKRGWTLQELLAPKVLEFWSVNRFYLGTRDKNKNLISEITGIPIAALCKTPLSRFTISERLEWRKNRETKRKEDEAYCLCGIFNVFLSPQYGEREHAWVRLNEEIHKPKKVFGDPTLGYGGLSEMKIHEKYLDVRTLRYYDIPFQVSNETGYILILRPVSQAQIDVLCEHTKRLRADTLSLSSGIRRPPGRNSVSLWFDQSPAAPHPTAPRRLAPDSVPGNLQIIQTLPARGRASPARDTNPSSPGLNVPQHDDTANGQLTAWLSQQSSSLRRTQSNDSMVTKTGHEPGT